MSFLLFLSIRNSNNYLLMKIQKKKFLSNLIKVQILKKKYVQYEHYQTILQTLHSLFLVYFVIISSNSALINPLFAALKSFSTALLSLKQIPFVLSSLVFTIGLGMAICFFYLMIGQDRVNLQGNKINIQRIMLRITAALSILFDLLGPVFLIIIISNLELNDVDSAFLNTLNLLCFMLSEAIIVYCNELLLYSNKFIFLLLAFKLIDGLLPYWMTISLSCYELFNTPYNRLPYLLVLIITIIVLLSQGFQSDINVINTAILFFLVIMINFFIPVNSFLQENENENDFLLAKIGKLSKDQELTSQQFFKIIFIFENMQIKHKEIISNEVTQNFAEFQSKKITKNELISFLMIKLDIGSKANPNDLNIKIQKFECQLLEKAFSIVTLYLIQKLSLQVENRCVFEELYRMESFLNKIEVEYLHSEDDINSAMVFKTEKKLERFYDCIGLCIQQLVNLWNITSNTIITEDIFQRSLTKVIDLEGQAFKILNQLKKFKNMAFQIDILNYLHRMVNVDGQNLMEVDPFLKQDKLKETKFILVSNQIIEDASNIIAKQISVHGEPIIGLDFSQVLYDFYNVFLHQQMNSIVSISQAHHEILIPFKIINHQKKFFLSQCTISILPDLSNGVKYIINFNNQKEYVKKYVIYCLQDDIIQGLSETFYQTFKVDEMLLPQILIGRQLFNIDLSSHLNEEKIVKNIKIKCQLMFKDIRKKKKTTRRSKHHTSIPLTLIVQDIYKVKNLHYILFEMQTKEETLTMTAKETIKCFVGGQGNGRVTTNQIVSSHYCKINNPLQSTIDDRLSRINNNFRISYFKIIIFLLIFVFLLILNSLIYIKFITLNISSDFKSQLNIVTNTNILTQTIYLLFYQYYQYYQVLNYPEQILSIQKYNVPAMVKQYYKKSNQNIVIMLPYILNNNNPQSQQTYSKIFQGYTQQETTAAINLVDFLDSTKTALATNSPIFMVRNQQIASQIAGSFLPYDNDIVDNFTSNMFNYLIVIIFVTIITCIVIKIIYFKICFFKWNLFKIYTEIGESQMKSYLKRLEDFVDLLVKTKYYDKRGENSKEVLVSDEVGTSYNRPATSHQLQMPSNEQVKGVKKSGYFDKLLNKNVMVLIPILTAFFFMLYFSSISTFAQESDRVLEYSKELQTFSVLILQRTTSYFQVGMEAILPKEQRKGWQKAKTLKVPTQLTVQLPSYFDSYKQIQKGMLDFNLCKYSYLNTGSLYKNINCSLILDGIMEKSFTQTYSYLLLKLQEQGGALIQDFGKQFRPKAKYPFYMELCYTRRTINNMLAFIQAKFNTTLNNYIQYRQTSMQNIINIGYIIIPTIIIAMLYFAKQIKDQCNFAIKCFKILPRKFIMKISMSKKLSNTGILDEIELIAA